MAGGLARPHLARLLDGPAEEEELLGDGGLAGVRVADDGKGAAAVDFLLVVFFQGMTPRLSFTESMGNGKGLTGKTFAFAVRLSRM